MEPVIEALYSEGSHLDENVHNLKPIPSVFFQTKEGQQGLKAQYYNNISHEGDPVLERVDDKIDFWWQHDPVSKDLVDNFQ